MKKLSVIILFISLSAISIIVPFYLLADGVMTYNVFRVEKAEAIVISKRAEQSLLLGSTYFVRASLVDEEGRTYGEQRDSEMLRNEFSKTELQDEIHGYVVNGKYFTTFVDLWKERLTILSIATIVLLVVFLFIAGFYAVMIDQLKVGKEQLNESRKMKSTKRKKKQKLKNNGNQHHKRESKVPKLLYTLIGIVSIVGFVYMTSIFSMSIYQKYKPYGKITSEATIESTDKDCSFRQRFTNDEPLFLRYLCSYHMQLTFNDDEGKLIQVDKQVSSGTYNKYEYAETITVNYLKQHPHIVYLKNSSFWELITISTSAGAEVEFYLYGLLLILTIWFYFHFKAVFRERRNKVS